MKGTAILQPRDVLALLDELGDDDLCAVIAHAQGCLLDRPIPSSRASTLAVEIVRADEGHLLALYRNLTPAGKHDLLARAWQRAHAPQSAQRHRIGAPRACPPSHHMTTDRRAGATAAYAAEALAHVAATS